jgi:hypothetical protein
MTVPGQTPFTLHYAQSGGRYTMESESVLALKAEARDMADKGWAHPVQITDAAGRVLKWDAFGVNEPGDVWEET